MNCVVFGGGGFIGSAVVDRLLLDGHGVRVFERAGVTPYRWFEPAEKMEWLTGDFLNLDEVCKALEGIEVVLHLVSFTIPQSSQDDPIYDIQTNVVATLQLLGAMQGLGIKRIIFISSGGTVYGLPQYLPIDENHPTDPLVPYGISKLTIEKYLLLYQRLYQFRSIILRVANPYGPRQRVETAQGAVAAFLHKACKLEPVEIWGDGSIERDYIYIDDLAAAFSKAIIYEGDHSIFNIGSGRGVSLNELLKTIEHVMGKPIQRQYMPGRSFDVRQSVLANDLAQSQLGWQSQVALVDGIRQTANWLRTQKP